MTWYCFHVSRPRQAEIVAENLRALAADPLTRSVMSPDVHVYRRQENGSEVFYFSPAAFLFFRPFIATYRGGPCDRPVATHDAQELRRLDLTSTEAWRLVGPGDLGAGSEDFPR